MVRGGVEPPTFRFSGALSRLETKNANIPAALLTGVTESGPELDVTAPAGYRGQGAVSPSGGPPSPRHHAPELMFCERGLTDAYFFSRHSYSAIRTVPDQISSHGL